MRHARGLAFCPKASFLLEPTFSRYQTALLISRSLFTPSSLCIRKKNENLLVQSTITGQVLSKTSETVDLINTAPPEQLPLNSNRDRVVPAEKKQEFSPILPQEVPGSTQKSLDPLDLPKSAPGLDSEPEHAQKYGCATVLPVVKGSTYSQSRRKVRQERKKVAQDRRRWEILNPAFIGHYWQERSFPSEMGTNAYIQFMTTPTSDTPGTALLLKFNERRYIFGNAHEGLQRASLQTSLRVPKSRDIFLTGRTDWKSTGGLLGIILSCAGATNSSTQAKVEIAREKLEHKRQDELRRKKKKVSDGEPAISPTKNLPVGEDATMRIHGGPNLTHTLATARSFIFRQGTPIKVLEHIREDESVDNAERNWEPTWSDDKIQVWAMPILPLGVSETNEDLKQVSPRKRSLGEFMTGERPTRDEILDQWSVCPTSLGGHEERNQRIREHAVSEMFSSAWSQNDLVEMPLRDVKMPATLFVRDPVTNILTGYQGPTPDGTAPMPNVNVLVRSPWPGASIGHLPSTKPSSTAMSYIIRTHRRRGKFKRAAAEALNVPSGPLWAALALGSPVTSDDGVTVTPDMVLEPSIEGCGVAVIELPSSEYVHNLVHRSEWKVEKLMNGVGVVIWILGPGVAQDQTLLRFIESQSGVQHIVSSPEHCPNYLPLVSAASAAIRHNQIDPARYAIPLHSNAVPSPIENLSDADETSFKLCQPARKGLRVELVPKYGVTENEVVPVFNTADVRGRSQDVLTLSQVAGQEISSPAFQAELLNQDLPSPDAEITCLGTGSSTPSAYRNVSATLLRLPGCGSYLFDCGENTLGQLKRLYTAPQLAELLRDLKLIWISHLHADHHLGLITVIKAWYEEIHGKDEVKRRRPSTVEQVLDTVKLLEEGKRLFVVGHGNLRRQLEEYSSVEDFGYDQLVPLISFPINSRSIESRLEWNGLNVGFNASSDPRIKSALCKATGLSDLASCSVSHCQGSQAVSLTFPTDFKFSYSGDCRPSKTFAEIGKHSTVLLHEATFDDELESQARAKKHSTTSEAIDVGLAMGARRVILTHFSQRYQNFSSPKAADTGGLKLEDAEDVDDPLAGMDQSVEDSTRPVESQATVNNALKVLDEESSHAQDEVPPQTHNAPDTSTSGPASVSPTVAQAPNISSNIDPPSRSNIKDMKIAVAFDYMRVKVGEIIHLEKFTPAFRQLYQEISETAKDRKAAKDYSDDEDDILKTGHPGKAENTGKRTKEEQAERARKGQIKAAKKNRDWKEKREKVQMEERMREQDESGKDEESKSGERIMEEVEMTEPVVEKLQAVQ